MLVVEDKYYDVCSESYFTVSMDLVSETNSLSLSKVVHARVIGVIHEVVDG